MSTRRGPIEDGTWPAVLQAHVVDSSAAPRIHGYDTQLDLARHHGMADVAYLAYAGELPTDAQRRMFELAMVLLAPAPLAEAPTHSAVLARLLAAGDANVVGLAAMLAAEQASALVRTHAAWSSWCERPNGPPPAEFLGSDDDAAAARALVDELGIAVGGVSDARATAVATAFALLRACGLGAPLRLVALVVQARLPCMIAEAERHTPRHLQSYPLALTAFDYVEDSQ